MFLSGMEDLAAHRHAFEKIAEKYGLKTPEKANEVADFLTKHHGKELSPKEFSKLFNMDEKDATVFLSFIAIGIKFKEKHIDPHQ